MDMITRESIAGAIRGAGLTNAEVSELTKVRAAKSIGVFVSPDAISAFLRRGEPGTDLGYFKVQSIVSLLEDEGVKFFDDGSMHIPEGLLSKRRGKEKIRGKGQKIGDNG